ncbi:MAG TPA: CocE/NonD family hydrolase [Solirubrobacteraceae bacterium]|nr:CocE/NonD family hydrolase [Solirubrobacteraceae bacterium]
MPGIARLRVNSRSAIALGVGLACVGIGAAPAWSVTPAPPPGAPAVESAPSSLVGLDPELPPGVVAASAAAGSHWTPEKAIYGTASTNDIQIKGAGGTTIRVDEVYPTTASGAPAKGPFPVLLTMTPYGKGQGGSTSPGSAASPGGSSATGGPDDYLAQRGYIEVVEDVRGTGDSNGSWGLFDPVQQRDAIKVLNWAAHLPNSDGRVGTYGPSYLGIDQLLLAGAVGPHSPLKAIFPMVSANDIYRDTSFMGGLLDFEFAETYLGLTGALNTANPLTDTASDPTMLSDLAGIETDHANGLATYHAGATANVLTGGDEAYDGSYWHARNPQNILARVVANHIPAYLIGGEFDIFQNGEPVNYAELQNAWDGRSTTAPMLPGQPTTGRYQLIVGPWEHLNGSSVDVDPLELEWFDTWLKHERTGMAGTPTPLHYYDLGSGQFDETSTYPFTGSTPTHLYFGAGGTLTNSAPAATATAATSKVTSPVGGVLGTVTGSAPITGVLGTVTGSAPITGVLGTVTGASPVPAAASDTLVWSPTGTPCGRPIDQWSMGGVSVPSGTAGLLAPCVNDDQASQSGPWAITYTTAPLSKSETVAGPVTATVYASATTSETELVAELEDVTPSGASYPLTEGALLGSLRAVNTSRSWTAGGVTILPYHPYTQASAKPVTPGAVTEYQIQIFPTLATIAAGNRLRLTLSSADAPHLTPLPEQLPELAGGVYTIARTAAEPSSVTVDLLK